MQPGSVILLPAGITSGELFGDALVIPDATVISPGGIASAEAMGLPSIEGGLKIIAPDGIASTEAFGSLVITGGAAVLGWLLGEIIARAALDGKVINATAPKSPNKSYR